MDLKTLQEAIRKVRNDYPRTTRLMSTARSTMGRELRLKSFAQYLLKELSKLPEPPKGGSTEGGGAPSTEPSPKPEPTGTTEYEAPSSTICQCKACKAKAKRAMA